MSLVLALMGKSVLTHWWFLKLQNKKYHVALSALQEKKLRF